jgi:hypothetical protein
MVWRNRLTESKTGRTVEPELQGNPDGGGGGSFTGSVGSGELSAVADQVVVSIL